MREAHRRVRHSAKPADEATSDQPGLSRKLQDDMGRMWTTVDFLLELKPPGIPQVYGELAPQGWAYQLALQSWTQGRTAAMVMRDPDNYWPAALVNVRVAYELAFTAQWILNVPDALNDWLRESSRNELHFLNGASDAGIAWGPMEQARTFFEGIRADFAKGTAETPARKASERLNDLEGAGSEAYLTYRWLSAFVHPSAHLISYVPSPVDLVAGLRNLAVALTWSDRVFDRVCLGGANSEALAGMADFLGCPMDLTMSQRAKARQASASSDAPKPSRGGGNASGPEPERTAEPQTRTSPTAVGRTRRSSVQPGNRPPADGAPRP